MVVSDHGAQCMYGGIQINEWLMQNGYLTLVDPPTEPTPDRPLHRSTGRGRGCGPTAATTSRIFLNVKGREPEGVDRAGRLRGAARRADRASSRRWATRRAARSAPASSGPRISTGRSTASPPDLIVYFGNLGWRSVGTVGDGRVHVLENDTGPDDANHAKYGIAIFDGPGMPAAVPPDARLFDIAPTVLTAFGLPVPDDMQGRSPDSSIDPAALLDELRTLAYEGRAYAENEYDTR